MISLFFVVQFKVKVDVILTNLADAVRDQLYHKVDLLLFNPPYVPTPSEEICKDKLTRFNNDVKLAVSCIYA